tara:strand:+ start:496 stop:837 length:342 start_codon:yes stop_codon:yes gene_type:complete
MDNKTFLIAILEKLESGEDLFPSDFPGMFNRVPRAIAASNGDLNGAYAYFEYHFPEVWTYNLAPGFCHVFPKGNNGDDLAKTGLDTVPARAWLKAMIMVQIAQQEGFYDDCDF